jgi:hypothetical protein
LENVLRATRSTLEFKMLPGAIIIHSSRWKRHAALPRKDHGRATYESAKQLISGQDGGTRRLPCIAIDHTGLDVPVDADLAVKRFNMKQQAI